MLWLLQTDNWASRLFEWGANSSSNVNGPALELLSAVLSTAPLDHTAVRHAAGVIAEMSHKASPLYFYKIAEIDLTRHLLLACGSSKGAHNALEVLDPLVLLKLVLDPDVLIRQRVIELVAEVLSDQNATWSPSANQILALVQSLVAMDKSKDAASLIGASAGGTGVQNPGRALLVAELKQIVQHALEKNKVRLEHAGLC